MFAQPLPTMDHRLAPTRTDHSTTAKIATPSKTATASTALSLSLLGAGFLLAVSALTAPPFGPAGADATDAAGAAPATECPRGFVPRDARPGDRLCVGLVSHDRVQRENRLAAQRVDPAAAAGAPRCLAPYVERGAVPGDDVCVTAAARRWVRIENTGAAAER